MSTNALPSHIARYLASTRLDLPDITSTDSKTRSSDNTMYEPMIGYINTLSEGLGIQVDIEIVYTDSFKSEAVTLNNRMHIIHDRYLGQVINMLNRLFLYGASHETRLTYSHKLASQIFSRYGFYEESIFAAQIYQDEKESMDHKKKQAENGSLIHGLYTHIQELYILLHEHAHLVFKDNKELLSQISEDVREWIIDYGQKESSQKLMMEALSQKDIPSDELKFYMENMDKLTEHAQLANDFCIEISNRTDLVEEFCCDRLAILHMVPYLKALSQLKSSDYIKAIVLCFLHLRTIQLLEARCSIETNYKFEDRENIFDLQENLYTIFYNARLHHIKEFCYDLFISEESEYEEIHSNISEMMYSHSDDILSPAENVVSNLLYSKEIRSGMKQQFDYIKENMKPDQHFMRIVSAMLHYAPSKK